VTALRAFIVRHGHDTLIPADDLALAAITERYDDFKDLVHVACPPPSVTRLVLNKSATLEIAQQCGIRVPRTVTVSNSDELSEYVDRFPFPWVLKPVEKKNRLEGSDDKSYIISTANDVALKFPAGREFSPPMLLQEFCAGAGVGVEVLMHQENGLAFFQHRRLKEHPYSGGVAVTAIAERPNPALLDSSLALLRALHWEGVAMVEFKVNPNEGSAVLMEVNGRYWGSIGLPILAGIDFPYYHWQIAHGERPEVPKTYAVGTRWRWSVGCLDRIYRLFGGAWYEAASGPVRLHELLHFAEDFSPVIQDATFTLSDPLPSMAALFHAIKFFIFPKHANAAEGIGPLAKRSDRF